MSKARIADYVIVPGTFILKSGVDLDKEATFPVEAGSGNAVLMFTAQFDVQLATLLEVKINGTQVFFQTVVTSPQHTILRVVNAGLILNNKIELRMIGTGGEMRISDVVVFYQRDIPTP